jgi:hypothetical protein
MKSSDLAPKTFGCDSVRAVLAQKERAECNRMVSTSMCLYMGGQESRGTEHVVIEEKNEAGSGRSVSCIPCTRQSLVLLHDRSKAA